VCPVFNFQVKGVCTQEEPKTLFFISTDLFSDSNILENKNHRITTGSGLKGTL